MDAEKDGHAAGAAGQHVTNSITHERLEKYFSLTGEALAKARAALDTSAPARAAQAEDFLDMAQRYYDDARFFERKGDWVNAFAALNYGHGWLDAGARIRLFKVSDSRLFTVDGEPGAQPPKEL